MLATSYPGGSNAFVFGLACVVFAALACLLALVGIALAGFGRTCLAARKLGGIAIILAWLSLGLGPLSTAFIIYDRLYVSGSPNEIRSDMIAAAQGLLIGLVPLVLGKMAKVWGEHTSQKRSGTAESR